MLVRISIPIRDTCGSFSPSIAGARRQASVRQYIQDTTLGDILTGNGVQYRVLDSYIFAVMDEEVFFAVRLACDLHFDVVKNNIAPIFKVTYDDPQEEKK